MHCETVKRLMNDLLDQTLPAAREREIEAHMAVCEGCRSEFQKLGAADELLKKVICEMMTEIEVPPGLSRRIEKVLAEAKHRGPAWMRLAALLKAPAVAAALLLAVAAAGFLGWQKPFSTAVKQPEVALNGPVAAENQSEVVTRDADRTAAPEEVPAADKLEVLQKYDSGAVQDGAGGGNSAEPEEKQELRDAGEVPAGVSREPGGQLRQNKIFSGASVETLNSGAPLLKKGTLEEAAAGAGFYPVKPAYLPEGARFLEAAWVPGAVYQNYRAGQLAFTVSQSRANGIKPGEGSRAGPGVAVEINGVPAVLQETGPEPGDGASRVRTVLRWVSGEWAFSVEGELPKEEIIKIAESLR
ncbi:hypothetical membrane protein [Pelotomaculum thermopropionicum SI]|uniref:Anti-sigma-W factor RsiW n=1 Tax=Pelotomaculum thermopropionicum (strain DSM 13744 / JCM 10971 / SI) TaxID=370438 RepID=A5D4J3_PELTS|nr:hypothetical membrane protein [Pelotomaculum thermopropionicum SI]